MNVRTTILLSAMALVLTACPHGDAFPEMTVASDELEGIVYLPYARTRLPLADLTPIGEASGTFGELVTTPTVFAIAGVEPSLYVAMQIDPERYEESIRTAAEVEPGWSPPPLAPSHMLYISTIAVDSNAPPAALCAYFDPRSEETPSECQGPVTVTLDGETYVAVGDGELSKSLPFTRFHVSDLQAIGTLDDIDPRLSFGPELSDTAYAIRGVEPAAAIVIAVGTGIEAYYYVFVAEGSTMPAEICRFADADITALIGCARGPDVNQAALDELRANEELWLSHDASEYSYTITVVCECPSEAAGEFRVHVVDSDHVESITIRGAPIALDDERAAWVPARINEAFGLVADYASSEILQVEYHDELGYPVSLFADPSTARDGDEYGFTITNLQTDR